MNKRAFLCIFFLILSFASFVVTVSAFNVGDTVPIYCPICNQVVGNADVNDSYQCSDILSYVGGHERTHYNSGWTYDHLEFYSVEGVSVRASDPQDVTQIEDGGQFTMLYVKNSNWKPPIYFYYRKPNTTGSNTLLYTVTAGDSGKLKSLPTPPSYSGYHFDGWSCSAVEGYVTLDTVFGTDVDNYVCYAQYSAVSSSLPVI